MNDFLRIEYEKCLELIKYYDERHQSVVKFAAGLSSGVPSLLLATFQLDTDATHYFWQFCALISAITTIGLLAIYTVLVQLRLYFVYPVRQVNALRKYFLEHHAEGFSDNQMYLDSSCKAFKWASSQTLLNGFVALQIGIFSGLTVYAIYTTKLISESRLTVSILVAMVTFLCCFGAAAYYLFSKGKFHPDKSIHGTRE